MYSNDYQTNTPANFYAQSTAPQYERNVSEAVAGPSLGIAHQQVDEAINRLAKSSAFLRETADRVLGAPLSKDGVNNVEPSVSGTLPGLLQKLGWLHFAIGEIETQAHRLSSL